MIWVAARPARQRARILLQAMADRGGERTRVTYTLDADPGRMLGLLLRGPVEGVLRAILVKARPGELKKRVEGG